MHNDSERLRNSILNILNQVLDEIEIVNHPAEGESVHHEDLLDLTKLKCLISTKLFKNVKTRETRDFFEQNSFH